MPPAVAAAASSTATGNDASWRWAGGGGTEGEGKGDGDGTTGLGLGEGEATGVAAACCGAAVQESISSARKRPAGLTSPPFPLGPRAPGAGGPHPKPARPRGEPHYPRRRSKPSPRQT